MKRSILKKKHKNLKLPKWVKSLSIVKQSKFKGLTIEQYEKMLSNPANKEKITPFLSVLILTLLFLTLFLELVSTSFVSEGYVRVRTPVPHYVFDWSHYV